MALDLDTARDAAKAAIRAFEEPANAIKLEQAQKECEGDIQRFFQVCIPLATDILGSIIQNYGFEPSQSGCMQFTAEIGKYKSDSEISRLEQQIKAKFMPHMG